MSAAFGTLENTSDHDITLVSAESPASTMLQLHETVANDSGAMVMKEKQGGFVIPAGGSFALEPGGNHIMLMDLTAPLAAGDEATFTLTFSDARPTSSRRPSRTTRAPTRTTRAATCTWT
jgi:copper(I)-binding protein